MGTLRNRAQQITQAGLSRRAAIAGVSSAALAGVLGACRSATPQSSTGQQVQPQTFKGPADITYQTSWGEDRLPALNEVIGLFQQKFPQIKVQVVPQPSGGYEKTIALFAAGSGPDSLWVAGQFGPKLYESGDLLDLTSRVKLAKLNLQEDYISSKLEFWAGKVFALPHTVSPHAWYYNKAMFKRLGVKDPWDDLKGDWTWSDLLEAARKTTMVQGSETLTWGIQLDYTSPWYQDGCFVWSNDGELIDTRPDPNNWRKWRYTFSNPRSVEAFQFIHDLLHQYKVLIPKAEASRLTQSGIKNLFAAEKVAMFENSSGQLVTLRQAVGTAFEWDVAPIPRVRPGARPGVPLWSGNPTAINSRGKAIDAAWELALFMALDEAQNVFSRARVVTAALKRSLSIPDGFETPPPAHVRVFRAVGFENSGSWNYHPEFNQIEQIATEELGKAFNNEKSMRQACQDIDARANAIMERAT